jgi:hypothetical protein
MVTLNLMVECKPGWLDLNHKPPKRDGGSKAKAERAWPAPDRSHWLANGQARRAAVILHPLNLNHGLV